MARNERPLILLGALCLATWFAGGAALGQNLGGADRPNDAPPARTTIIYSAKNASAKDLADVLNKLFAGQPFMAVPYERTNSILVQAPRHIWENVSGVLKELDVAAASPEADQVRIFRLTGRVLDGDFEKLLLAGLPAPARLAFDRRANVVIASANSEAMASLGMLLKELDQPIEKPRPKTLHLQVAWLVSGLAPPEGKEPQPVPPDLQKVEEELGKRGIVGLQLAAQPSITALAGHEFSMFVGFALEKPTEVVIKGQITEMASDLGKLSLTLTAVESRGNTGGPVPISPPGALPLRTFCNLQTEVFAPYGHPVVLCMTPSADVSSVFVLRLTEVR